MTGEREHAALPRGCSQRPQVSTLGQERSLSGAVGAGNPQRRLTCSGDRATPGPRWGDRRVKALTGTSPRQAGREPGAPGAGAVPTQPELRGCQPCPPAAPEPGGAPRSSLSVQRTRADPATPSTGFSLWAPGRFCAGTAWLLHAPGPSLGCPHRPQACSSWGQWSPGPAPPHRSAGLAWRL